MPPTFAEEGQGHMPLAHASDHRLLDRSHGAHELMVPDNAQLDLPVRANVTSLISREIWIGEIATIDDPVNWWIPTTYFDQLSFLFEFNSTLFIIISPH